MYAQAKSWSPDAVKKGYIASLNASSKRAGDPIDMAKSHYQEARTFGSKTFQSMWGTDFKNAKNLQAAQKLLVIAMKYSEMPQELDGTSIQAGNLVNKINPNLSPDDPFWKVFSKTVQKAYPGDSLASTGGDEELKRKIHQFRYVISAHQAQWVRNNYEGKTDAEKLAKYLKSLDKSAYNLNESSRLHNKAYIDRSGNRIYPGGGTNQANFKVLTGFYTEFIMDQNGNFLNEIDPEGTSPKGIVNGASYNYADKNGTIHNNLDVDPTSKWDPKYRKDIIDNNGKKFVSPNNIGSKEEEKPGSSWENSYHNPEGRYAIRDGSDNISSKENVDNAIRKFKKEIERHE